jgi:short subunit dehydrogenase-like uncharacterized protein
MSDTEFELLVWGASGFTGALVAQYLARLPTDGPDGSLRWALAGRNRAKLEDLRCQLDIDVPIVTADSDDASSLDKLVATTKVVLSTVGPYAIYGSKLVAACAQAGTHYCDLAGEVPWMRRMIDEHSVSARASGARLVHSCGFDSIPSDLGVLFVHNAMRDRAEDNCAYIKYRAAAFKGGFSGGTVASMMHMMEQAQRDPTLRVLLAKPYALNPAESPGGLDGPDINSPRFDADFDSYVAPFVMSGINTRIVRRSNALLQHRYGHEFRYDEATLMGAGGSGFAKALASAMGTGAMTGASAVGPLRRLLQRVLPKPGEGPTVEQQEAGYFRIELFARALGDHKIAVRAEVEGDRDPGYGSTAKMLAQSAICLARDDIEVAGGFWTPASAMGELLIERLHQRAGVTFKLI